MKNIDKENKLFFGLVLSGLVAAASVAVVYGLQHSHSHKKPFKKLGKTITEIGEMLEKCDLGAEASIAVENVEQKVVKSDIFNQLTKWLDSGLTVWKQFKRG